jgi:hypothetical protein
MQADGACNCAAANAEQEIAVAVGGGATTAGVHRESCVGVCDSDSRKPKTCMKLKNCKKALPLSLRLWFYITSRVR